MYENICRSLLENGVRLVYVTGRPLESTLKKLEKEYPSCCVELVVNEKIAYELALAGSYTGKRTACIFSTTGLYDALDPLMSSAYTGSLGGFVVVCIRETDEEITPLGPFSKLPVIVSEEGRGFTMSLNHAYWISEKYEIPVLLQTTPEADEEARWAAPASAEFSSSRFVKDPNRWAATPKFRYQLHKTLNDKIEKIRDEFEQYPGNIVTKRSSSGIITSSLRDLEFFDDDASVFLLSTVFPAPLKALSGFIDAMDQTVILEGGYPVIELQMEKSDKVGAEKIPAPPDRKRQNEEIAGLRVVRDWLGPGSSINIAHGMKKTDPAAKILAITFEDFFFHSGMPAVVNTLYNQSRFVILVLTRQREDEIAAVLKGFGFENYRVIHKVSDIEAYSASGNLTVLFFRGIV